MLAPGQISVSFLPLSHVTARHADFALLYRGVTLAYCPFIENLPQALLEVRPQILVAVPRVYEKLYSQVEQNAKGFPRQAIYRWALSVGPRECFLRFWRAKYQPPRRGSWPINCCIRRCAPGWGAECNSLSRAERPWAKNWQSGSRPSGFAFTKAMA